MCGDTLAKGPDGLKAAPLARVICHPRPDSALLRRINGLMSTSDEPRSPDAEPAEDTVRPPIAALALGPLRRAA
jgi:hypothetical protein